MSFSVESKAAPAIADSGANVSKAQDARAKAIAMLSGSAPQGSQELPPAEVVQSQAQQNVSGQASPSEPSSSESVAETTPAKKEEPLSSQYAVLARKEKQLRIKAQQQELAFKQREEAIRQRESEYGKKDQDYSSNYISKDRLKQDPLGTLSEMGMTYDEITQLALSQPQIDPALNKVIQELKMQIKELKGENEGTRKSITDQQTQSYNEALRHISLEAKDLVKNDSRFETIRETGQLSEVVDLIKKTFDQDGILLTVEEAAQAVEDELVEEAMKISRLSKIQQKIKAATEQTPKPTVDAKKTTEMKTLTNAVSSSRQLSARERALLAFKGELKK